MKRYLGIFIIFGSICVVIFSIFCVLDVKKRADEAVSSTKSILMYKGIDTFKNGAMGREYILKLSTD